MKRVLITLAILLASLTLVFAQNETSTDQTKEEPKKEGRPRISVKTFENPSMYYNSTIGTGVTDMLITKLVKSGRFNVIARHESFQEVKDEIDLGDTGYIEEESKVEKGKVRGVEYILMGKVTNFGYKESGGGLGGILPGGFGDVDVSKKKAQVQIDFRLVEAKTGETIIAESAEGLEKSGGLGFSGGNFGDWIGHVNWETTEFLDSMVGKATVKAVDEIAKKLVDHFPLTGAIVAVSGDKIVIDLGEGAGLKVGQKFKVLELNAIRDSGGDVVFEEEKEIGEVAIDVIQLKSSLVRIISGCEGVKEGNLVRAIETKKEEKKKQEKDEDED